MAGDWIKMRSDLRTHPKVVRISSALKADKLRIVGALHAAWCLFDAHSEDGSLFGYTNEALDDEIGLPGFSAALQAVGWLESDGESLLLPRFDTHNGASAKKRAQDADRKRDVRKASASEADKSRTREEKRREEVNQEKESATQTSDDGLAQVIDIASVQALSPATLSGIARRFDISAGPTDPRFYELLAKGVTPETFAEACRIAKERADTGSSRPNLGYAITTALDLQRRADDLSEAPAHVAPPKATSRGEVRERRNQAVADKWREKHAGG